MQWFRRIAVGLTVVVVLFAIVLVALVLLVDPNHYKAPVADAIKTRYGRTLRIDGDLRLTAFPRLGVEVEKVSLSEPDSTQIFAVVDTARVSVALLPLLSRRVVADHIRVEGLKANVVRYRDGRLNFEDLLGKGRTPAAPAAPAASDGGIAVEGTDLQMDVAGVELSGGELAWRDFVSGHSMRLERVSASTGRIAPGVPVAFTAAARVLGMAPRVDAQVESRGTLSFDPATRRYAAQDVDFRANGVLPSVRVSSVVIRGDAAYDGQRSAIDASGVSVQFQGDIAGATPLTGIDARLEAPRLGISLDEGRLELEKLAATVQGKAGADAFDFSLDAPRLAVSGQQAGGDPMRGRLRVGGQPAADVRFSLEGVSGSSSRLALQRLAVEGEVRQGPREVRFVGQSPVEANLEARRVALARIDAQVNITDPGLPGAAMQIPLNGSVRADFGAQTLSVKANAMLEGGKLNATLDASQFSNPRIAFSVNADTLDFDKLWPTARHADGKPAQPSTAPARDTPVDLGVLQDLTINGNARIGRLVVRGLKANDVAATVRVAKGRADVTGIRAALYGGALSGSAFADANTQRIGLAPVLTNVAVQPLLADLLDDDRLSGQGNVALNVTASGKTVHAMERSLNGTLQLQLRDGAVKGINLAQSLRDFKAVVGTHTDTAGQADRARQTDFSELGAQVVFANGVGTVRSLNLKAPLIRVDQGQPARVDVARGVLDLVLRVHVVNTSTGQDGKDLAQLRNVMVPVHLTGEFGTPTYKILWSQVGAELLRENLRSQIDEKLGITDKAQREQLKENVRERLRDLFR